MFISHDAFRNPIYREVLLKVTEHEDYSNPYSINRSLTIFLWSAAGSLGIWVQVWDLCTTGLLPDCRFFLTILIRNLPGLRNSPLIFSTQQLGGAVNGRLTWFEYFFRVLLQFKLQLGSVNISHFRLLLITTNQLYGVCIHDLQIPLQFQRLCYTILYCRLVLNNDTWLYLIQLKYLSLLSKMKTIEWFQTN